MVCVLKFAGALETGRQNLELEPDSFAVQGGQDRLSQGVTALVNELLKREQLMDTMHLSILQNLKTHNMSFAKSEAEEKLRKEMETNRKNCAVAAALFRIQDT